MAVRPRRSESLSTGRSTPDDVTAAQVAAVIVAGSINVLNVAVTKVALLTAVAPLAGLTDAMVGGSVGALLKTTSTQ